MGLVLRITPGTGEEQISLMLREFDLHDKDSGFGALSYVWGDHSLVLPVECNGKTMWITESLHSALWQLRQEEHQGYFWADAVCRLCTNQSDLEEKNQQVRRMVDIYKAADLVLVWLGEEGEEERVGYDFLCDIVKTVNDAYERRSSDRDYLDTNTLLAMFSVDGCSAMMRLLNKPWFTRAWVVQEYWAATVRRFQCGQLKMDPDMLVAFKNIFVNRYDLSTQYQGHCWEYKRRPWVFLRI